jgi:tetratricopeptide (TPR) repeat protein
LVQNRIDSPVRIHLGRQQQNADVNTILREAENAIRSEPLPDLPKAIAKFKEAIRIDPDNPLLYHQLGLMYKNQGKWDQALKQFTKATELSPEYSDAFREKGIAENKIYLNAGKPPDLPSGESSLSKAIELNPEDFDAYASLGGILKREERYQEAFEMYKRSSDISGGNPYPFLNELKLHLLIDQTPAIDGRYKFYLKKIERILRAQVSTNPPFDAPWCFFSLSEVCLFQGDEKGFDNYLDEGIYCINPQTLKWHAKTHRESLEILQQSKLNLPGLSSGIEKLRESEKHLPEKIN